MQLLALELARSKREAKRKEILGLLPSTPASSQQSQRDERVPCTQPSNPKYVVAASTSELNTLEDLEAAPKSSPKMFSKQAKGKGKRKDSPVSSDIEMNESNDAMDYEMNNPAKSKKRYIPASDKEQVPPKKKQVR